MYACNEFRDLGDPRFPNWMVSVARPAVAILLAIQLSVSGVGLVYAEDATGRPDMQRHVAHRDTKGKPTDLSRWHPQYRKHCHFPNSGYPDGALREALDVLKREATLGAPLLRHAEDLKTAFCVDDRALTTTGYFDHEFNVIAVSSVTPAPVRMSILVHELRHLRQFMNGFCVSTDYDMHEMIRVAFAMEADAQAVATLFAWRMKKQGEPEIWDGSSAYAEYADIYKAFADNLGQGGDEMTATRASFVQWYKRKSRTEKYYRNYCMQYLDLQDAEKAAQSYKRLPDGYFRTICALPDGSNYGCHLTAEIREAVRLPDTN